MSRSLPKKEPNKKPTFDANVMVGGKPCTPTLSPHGPGDSRNSSASDLLARPALPFWSDITPTPNPSPPSRAYSMDTSIRAFGPRALTSYRLAQDTFGISGMISNVFELAFFENLRSVGTEEELRAMMARIEEEWRFATTLLIGSLMIDVLALRCPPSLAELISGWRLKFTAIFTALALIVTGLIRSIYSRDMMLDAEIARRIHSRSFPFISRVPFLVAFISNRLDYLWDCTGALQP
ncbi:unnamed protein product [Peniophora sp. CBMAI 1063]|nr:unnamed protein product [Peniophora sp. CBMAI 1063]